MYDRICVVTTNVPPPTPMQALHYILASDTSQPVVKPLMRREIRWHGEWLVDPLSFRIILAHFQGVMNFSFPLTTSGMQVQWRIFNDNDIVKLFATIPLSRLSTVL